MNTETVIRQTRKWVEELVVGLSLCPFARAPFEQDKIRYVVVEGSDPTLFYAQFVLEVHALIKAPVAEIETTLLITPDLWRDDFEAYLDALAACEQLLEETNLIEAIQLASFHPDYQFDGTKPEDVENYTNRSPFPMFHLLRAASVEKAVAAHPAPAKIPETNIETMRKLGIEHLENLMNEIRKEN
ncbi:MAG: DUF1415 domain-containing protein [Bacteroidetes bacterium]|nr:MAG: DUF1415 domain-containing protein [Bacteroidota bacterium]